MSKRNIEVSEERLVEEGEVAGDYLEQLLDILDFDGDIDLDVEGDRAIVSIDGSDDLHRLVGSEGSVLDAIQELTRLAVQQELGDRSRLMLDIAGWRAAKREALTEKGRVVAQVFHEETTEVVVARRNRTGDELPLRRFGIRKAGNGFQITATIRPNADAGCTEVGTGRFDRHREHRQSSGAIFRAGSSQVGEGAAGAGIKHLKLTNGIRGGDAGTGADFVRLFGVVKLSRRITSIGNRRLTIICGSGDRAHITRLVALHIVGFHRHTTVEEEGRFVDLRVVGGGLRKVRFRIRHRLEGAGPLDVG